MFLPLLKFLLLWLLPLFALADHVHWLGEYNGAFQKAYAAHKPLLVLLIAKDSPSSKTVIKNIFMNQPYIETINEKMVAVIVTYEGGGNYPVELYYTTVFPTLFLVDAQKEIFLYRPLYGKEITPESVQKYINVQEPEPSEETRVGNDTDLHGCIGSAGFLWCARSDQCERPWELAKKEKFENSVEAFNRFCKNR